MMLQRYLPEAAAGEYAHSYIAGEDSHGVLRHTGVLSGEQVSLPVLEPPPDLRMLAEDVMASQYEAMPVYARVDIVPGERGPVIMELELTEPYLFFDEIPYPQLRDAALRRFALEVPREIADQRVRGVTRSPGA